VSTPTTSRTSLLEFAITFALFYFLLNIAFNHFFPSQSQKPSTEPAVTISMESKTMKKDGDPVVLLRNTTDKDIPLPQRCPMPMVDIAFLEKKSDGTVDAKEIIPNDSLIPCVNIPVLRAKETIKVSLAPWKYTLFGTLGNYRVSFLAEEDVAATDEAVPVSTEFTVVEANAFTKVFRTFITKPLLNSLVFIASWVPHHDLALSIIILTLITKLLLLLPNQHALRSQKKMQEMQPRMDEIKKKYPNDPQKVQEETVKLWKELKINPLESCLPTLLQLPILIGLFFVIRDSIHLALSRHLLYAVYSTLPANYFDTMLFGFDLLAPEKILSPLLLILLQFVQMKMMMRKNAKKATEIVVKPTGKKSWIPELDQQTIFLYVMPLMIGYFALQFPLAVSIYWGISTVFGIAQQWYVLRKD
jgi:YidC/Oxa1 family membrane protein insertase